MADRPEATAYPAIISGSSFRVGMRVLRRRGWDSNPRGYDTRLFSRQLPSTARPPLPAGKPAAFGRAGLRQLYLSPGAHANGAGGGARVNILHGTRRRVSLVILSEVEGSRRWQRNTRCFAAAQHDVAA